MKITEVSLVPNAPEHQQIKEGEKRMKLVKLQFMKDGVEHGKEYTYLTDDETLKPGDIVQVSEPPMGVITQVDVPEEEVASFKDKLKKIVGKAPVKESED